MAIGRGIYSYLAAEHVLVVYMMASGLSIPTKTQYIERRIGKSLGAGLYDESTCLANKSNPEYGIQEEVQRQSTMWMLYITICIQFPAIIMSNVWGALSDRFGRYVACALPCIGLMLNYVIAALVVFFELPLLVFLAGSLILGLSGDLTTLVVGCAGYISDVTLPKSRERAIRFVLIDVVFTFSTSVINFAIGYIITDYGFIAPFYIGMILIAICACFIVFFLPDRRSYLVRNPISIGIQENRYDGKDQSRNPLNIVRNVYDLFRGMPGRQQGQGWRLAAYNFIICAYIMLIVANSVISVLFTTGEPFCLNPVQEGHYGATMFAAFTAGTLLAGTILQRFVPAFWIMHLTSISVIASVIILAIAKTSLYLYISLVVGMFTYMALPLSRNNMANLVESHKQGVLFAFSGCLTGLAAFVAPMIFNGIYSSTLHFMPGFVYLVMALVGGLAWIIIIILHATERSTSTQGYQPLAVSEPNDPTSESPGLDDVSMMHDDDIIIPKDRI